LADIGLAMLFLAPLLAWLGLATFVRVERGRKSDPAVLSIVLQILGIGFMLLLMIGMGPHNPTLASLGVAFLWAICSGPGLLLLTITLVTLTAW
jgi:hypothetical protein